MAVNAEVHQRSGGLQAKGADDRQCPGGLAQPHALVESLTVAVSTCGTCLQPPANESFMCRCLKVVEKASKEP